MPGKNDISVLLLNQISTMVAASNASAEETKKALIAVRDLTDRQNVLLAEILAGQKQFQSLTVRYGAYFVIVLFLIIAGLLMALNVKGADTISNVIAKVVTK